jgi:hypothetical protein
MRELFAALITRMALEEIDQLGSGKTAASRVKTTARVVIAIERLDRACDAGIRGINHLIINVSVE